MSVDMALDKIEKAAQEAADYTRRRLILKENMDSLAYGSKQDSAFAIKVNPSTVSAVLNGRTHSPAILSDLEKWYAENASKYQRAS